MPDYTEPEKSDITYDEPNEAGWFSSGWFSTAWLGRKSPAYTETSKPNITYTSPDKGS